MALSRSSKLLIALSLIFIFGLLWATYLFYQLSPAQGGPAGSAIGDQVHIFATSSLPIVIEKGEGFREIANQLAQNGFVRSESMFKTYAILSGSAHKFKPGLYTFTAASSSIEIVRALVNGPSKEITVLIREGETLAEINTTLARYGVIPGSSLAKLAVNDFREKYPFLQNAVSLEGFLFPDTYRFYFGSTAQDVALAMLDNFKQKIDPLISDEGVPQYDAIPVLRRGIFTLPQILTIASMIENEVPGKDDRRIVADIIYRRLKIGMALQIDATTEYANFVGDDRFDTYKNSGLPRGPISNSGLDAIEAALNPKSSTYLYYLTDPKTKKTIFSKDFEEHKMNRAKYLP